MSWPGIGLAVAAACANSGIDALRKLGSTQMTSEELVSLVALFDAVISCSFVTGVGGFSKLKLKRPNLFAMAVVLSSFLLLAAKLLYQKALTLSPISLTVPYLSFTPAILVVTAYVFVGETPSWAGLAGVCVVTTSGYLLSLHSVPSPRPPQFKKDKESELSFSRRLSNGDDAEQCSPCRSRPGLPSTSSRVSCGPVGDHMSVHFESMRQEPGTLLMLAVAGVWSITATLDKIGVVNAPSLSVYLALQRLVIGLLCLGYILLYSRPTLGLIISKFWLLFSISTLELGAVVFFLSSLEYIFVSYAVAIKRCGILFSVLLGAFYFKEDAFSRLPYIVFMLIGMILIVLEPAHMLHSHTK
jgi:drug/metabolite transporter (DMT)-like permease